MQAVKNGTATTAIASVDQEISQLVETVRDIQTNMAGMEEKIKAAKDRLRMLLAQKGENWSDGRGYARLMSDSVRTSYDTKSLDQLIITDPLRHGWLKEYRKEFTVRGGVQVK
jgi:septal ring factor EnvC (AmiA/AmiB activator)